MLWEDSKLHGADLGGIISTCRGMFRSFGIRTLGVFGEFFFSPNVLWGFTLHLCMRWWVRVTAHFTTRTSSLSCTSFSMKVTSDHRETHASVSCISEDLHHIDSLLEPEIKPSKLLAWVLNFHPKPSTFNYIDSYSMVKDQCAKLCFMLMQEENSSIKPNRLDRFGLLATRINPLV